MRRDDALAALFQCGNDFTADEPVSADHERSTHS